MNTTGKLRNTVAMLFSKTLIVFTVLLLLTGCTSLTAEPTALPEPAEMGSANLPNPASVYCQEQGYTLEIRTAEDGSQSGVCVFPDGSECDEWAFFRNECGPASQNTPEPEATVPDDQSPVEYPTPLPIDPADYQGWWTYTHSEYGFSFMLPEDWVVDETSTGEGLLEGHLLNIHPQDEVSKENIRMTFRKLGEEVLLWPTGVGQGEFVQLGTLDITNEPAQRIILVCPSGEITSIWYHQADGFPNIQRGDFEFGFIYSIGTHCETGYSLGGKVQRVGEMIIASLSVP